ncbi:MAG: redox-sensing transcriptional repressor Rex [Candidatus Omnitrophica bacterium]|nr:redox-sensing transcriptional repressor Rex [Candidatus Omnitrophota bacterium]
MRKNYRSIPEETVRRLSLYLRTLRFMENKGVRVISSERLTKHLNITGAQARKDLTYFGSFGQSGVGYNIHRLREKIEEILGLDRSWSVILVGCGKLGAALLTYPGFRRFGFRILAAFDNNPVKVGQTIGGVPVIADQKMEGFIRKNKIKVAIVTVPAEAAQEIARRLAKSGISAILNFAPRYLVIPENIRIKSVDMAMELESLVYYLTNK